ncbi:ABC transporter substrate-binding protein [Desertihabitans aurantiacus]|uniref:ABC transporter substrate-binding protein n=1 Tax=Desertihabitans aurantiacus TaxID=2282477 RepID=UPI000DF791AB|nr:ABC transporter substrate-binding protein [Desertihabitans aurantiacus]
MSGPLTYHGLTWDHPRGRDALVEAARRLERDGAGIRIRWETQPLEGFESTPVAQLAADHDLLVLDHPHLGEAVAAGHLLPLDPLLPAGVLAALEREVVGPSLASYRLDGSLWALPLDAATQVLACRPDRVEQPPGTWEEVLRLARRMPVAPALAGPHALLGFAALCVALGRPPATDPDRFVEPGAGAEAFAVLQELARTAPAGTSEQNPIALLERMDRGGDLACVPLVYGYVGYSGPGHHVRYADAPTAYPGGPVGSTLGGTGVALTGRTASTPDLLEHLTALVSEPWQRGLVPDHSGQPSLRAAWDDPRLDAATDGFYRRTRRTMDHAWVRPRHRGWIGFQDAGSALLRDALTTPGTDAAATLTRLDALYRQHLPTPQETAR